MKYIRNKGIYSKKIEGVVYVLEPNKKYMRELNDVAGFIWDKLEKPISMEKLQAQVCKNYKVAQDRVAVDVKEFIDDYVKDGYILYN